MVFGVGDLGFLKFVCFGTFGRTFANIFVLNESVVAPCVPEFIGMKTQMFLNVL